MASFWTEKMKFFLDSPVIFGKTVVAAVSRNTISENMSNSHIAVTGAKYPVVLLVKSDDLVIALNPNGTSVTLNDVEILCPGMISQFETAAKSFDTTLSTNRSA